MNAHWFTFESLQVLGFKVTFLMRQCLLLYFFQTISRFGGIDILVSNAAANPVFGPLLDVSSRKL